MFLPSLPSRRRSSESSRKSSDARCRRRRRTRVTKHRLRGLESLEDRRLLALIVWDGEGGDNVWSNPANWAGDVLPGAADDVLIDAAGSVTIEHTGSNTSIRSLDSRESLRISGGSLTVAASGFAMAPGTTLRVDGTAAPSASEPVEFIAMGNATIHGVSFVAEDGGRIEIFGAINYTHASTGNWQTRTISASGVNAHGTAATVRLPDLEAMVGGTHYASRLRIVSQDGGGVELPSVKQIVDAGSGDTRLRSVDITADGAGSQVDLGNLQLFTDRAGYESGDRDGRWSTLSATGGGTIDTGSLREIEGVYLTASGPEISLPQLTRTYSGRLDIVGTNQAFASLGELDSTSVVIDGVQADFSSVESLHRSSLTLQNGGTADVSNVVQIDGASFYVSGGVTLALPLPTHYNVDSSGSWQHRRFRASGENSRLELPQLTSITGGVNYAARLYVEAMDGGFVDLSSVRQITDGDGGDTRLRSVDVSATGAGSQIDLQALETFSDSAGYESGDHDGRWSTLSASGGGTVVTSSLRELEGVYVVLSEPGAIDTSQLQRTYSGRLDVAVAGSPLSALAELQGTVIVVDGVPADLSGVESLYRSSLTLQNGGTADVSNVVQIDGASFYVSGGVTLALPSAAYYNVVSSGSWQHRRFRATGAGSLLDLSGLTSLINGTHYAARLYVDAVDGGVVDLGGVTEILDPNEGDFRLRSVDVTADGAGSRIELDSLINFIDYRGYESGDRDGRWSTLTEVNGGVINVPQLDFVTGVAISMSSTSLMPAGVSPSTETAGSGDGTIIGNDQPDTGTEPAGSENEDPEESPPIQPTDAANGPLPVGGNVSDNAVTFALTDLIIDFDSNLDPALLDLAQVSLIDFGADGVLGGGDDQSVTLTGIAADANQLTITPAATLPAARLHLQIAASTLGDTDGNVRTEDLVMAFTNVAEVPGTVQWIGPSGDWAVATNWSTGVIPSGEDNVRIELIGLDATVTISGGSQNVRDLVSTEVLSVSGGSLTVGGTATVTGELNLAANTSLIVSGDRASFVATGGTSIDGASLYALWGGEISLPAVSAYSVASTGSWQHRSFSAEGAGSRIELPGLLTIGGGTHYAARLYIQAVTGGQIELGALTEIVDPSAGDLRLRSVDVSATGPDSRVDLSALDRFIDVSGYESGDADGRWSSLFATKGGTILAGAVTELSGVYLATDTIQTPALETVTNGRLEIRDVDRTYASLTTVSGTQIAVQQATANLSQVTSFVRASLTLHNGGAVDLSGVTNVDGSSFYVYDGSQLTLAGVTTYDVASTGSWQHRYFRAEGAGSLIAFPNLTSITGGTHYAARLYVQANTGGRVDLDAVTAIEEPAAGDLRLRSFDISSRGPGSQVDLSALTRITDLQGWESGDSDGRWSTLSVSLGGELLVAAITELAGVYLTTTNFDVPGLTTLTSGRLVVEGIDRSYPNLATITGAQVAVRQATANLNHVTSFTRGSLSLYDGGVVDVSGVTNADSSSFYVYDGSQLVLAGVTSYDVASNGSWQHRYFRAEGTGSLVDLPNLTSITGGTHYAARLHVQAKTGGHIDLDAVTAIEEPTAGDLRLRSFDISSRGPGSQVDLSALDRIIDRQGWESGDADGRWSTLSVSLGGSLLASGLTELAGVYLPSDVLDTPLLTSLSGGRLDVTGVDRTYSALITVSGTQIVVQDAVADLSQVTSLTGSSITLHDRGTIDLTAVANIDGSSFYLYDGTNLTLSAITTYDHISTGSWQSRVFRAEGSGSQLNLPNLADITGGTHYASSLYIQARTGGSIDLSSTVAIMDPAAGDTRIRAIDVLCEGVGSVVNLSSLEEMTDQRGTASGTTDGRWSTLTARYSGRVELSPAGTVFTGTNVSIDGRSTLDGSVTLATNGRLEASGTITGTLITSMRRPKQQAKKSPTGASTSGFSRPSQ